MCTFTYSICILHIQYSICFGKLKNSFDWLYCRIRCLVLAVWNWTAVSLRCARIVRDEFEHQSLFVLFSSFFRIPGSLLGVKISKKKAQPYSSLKDVYSEWGLGWSRRGCLRHAEQTLRTACSSSLGGNVFLRRLWILGGWVRIW